MQGKGLGIQGQPGPSPEGWANPRTTHKDQGSSSGPGKLPLEKATISSVTSLCNPAVASVHPRMHSPPAALICWMESKTRSPLPRDPAAVQGSALSTPYLALVLRGAGPEVAPPAWARPGSVASSPCSILHRSRPGSAGGRDWTWSSTAPRPVPQHSENP